MKKAFSLLETIFVIALISIISVIAIPKLFFNVTTASYSKIKSDVALIRNAIIENRNKNIISGKGEAFIHTLDEAKNDIAYEKLFVGEENNLLLQYPIISTSSKNKESGKWIKMTKSTYLVYIDDKNSIEFTYDSNSGTFDCDFEKELCKDFIK